jgi:hypothetical protein
MVLRPKGPSGSRPGTKHNATTKIIKGPKATASEMPTKFHTPTMTQSQSPLLQTPLPRSPPSPPPCQTPSALGMPECKPPQLTKYYWHEAGTPKAII